MFQSEHRSFIVRLLGGSGGIGSQEGEAVNSDGGGEAGAVIGALFGGVVLGQTPVFPMAELLKLRLVHSSTPFPSSSDMPSSSPEKHTFYVFDG
ncbi:hypothetical protein SAY87_017646 [Trapa incisa]|uniref:Uncharacterized protein n=1 Tax=Trapa incisa TaxID=236973 RepID=A0AAN7L449_9MYRT|nr:hypothetical protein SAY87_017646 [Trapa incisa]